MAISSLAPSWLTVPPDANSLDNSFWPHSAGRDDGQLTVGGVRARDLADEFGTPLYVIDEEHARSAAERIRAALQSAAAAIGTEATVYYAGKALLTTDVVRWMLEAGLGIDVCSGGELAVALAAGAPGASLALHGNDKSEHELEAAVAVGAGSIVIDSLQEIERVARVASAASRRQPVLLRVSTGVHAHTHDYLATAHEDQKFGIPLARAQQAAELVRRHPSLQLRGLHCHIGSQIFTAGGFAESARRLLAVHASLSADQPLDELNLGGGFGVAYTSADSPEPIEQIAADICSTVAEECAALGIPIPRLVFEPGRSVIAQAGVTLYTVGTTKAVEVPVDEGTATRLYVSVDGGMSDNARPALYGADYAARLAARVSDAPPALVRVAGRHCESGDILVDAEYLPGDVAPGDLLAIPVTGAYCFALSSNYNWTPRPPVVTVRAGSARLLVRGETLDDLLARDLGAHGVESASAAPAPDAQITSGAVNR